MLLGSRMHVRDGRATNMIAAFVDKLRRKVPTTAGGVAAAPVESDDEARYKPIELSLVRRLLEMLKPYKREYGIAMIIGLVHVLLDMFLPKTVGWIVDTCDAYVRRTVDLKTTVWWLIGLNVFWIGTFALSVVFQRLLIVITTRAGESVQFDLRQRMFNHLQMLSMSYYDKTKLGRIISRMTSDIGSLREVNVWGIWQVFANAMIMVVAAAFLLATDWRLFLAVGWLGIPLFIINRRYLRELGRRHQIVREGWTRVSTNLAENITGMRVVTAYDRQNPNLSVFNRLQQTNTENNITVARINGIYQPILGSMQNLGRAIVLLFGGYLIATGRISSVGSVVAAFWYWDWFMGPIINLGNFINQMMMAMAGAERVFNLLDTKPDVFDQPDAKPLPHVVGNVKFEDVTFGYNPERPVLHEVNFEAQPGQVVALVGHTGSGKSSIVSLIARFYQPQKGRVLVDGNDLRQVTGESLHRQMGMVLQTNFLFTGTVLENIQYAKPGATEEEIINAAKSIGSHDVISSMANGYKSDVGERGGSMSLGQRQLICFTRAFLADPRIFLLDEATSAVDTGTEQLVQESLEKLLAGRTTFIVAHRLSTILRADVILVIDQGRIIERGTHRELLDKGGKYAQLYRQFVQHSS
jgi:ATP-binding cassette subfamily B protein